MKTDRAKKTNRALTLIEVLVVIAVIVILALLLLPARRRPGIAPVVRCASNLKLIGLALRTFAGDNSDNFPTALSFSNGAATVYDSNRLISSFHAMSDALGSPTVLVCPADTRKAATNFNSLKAENISYFLSLDAKPELTNAITAGDRNLRASGEAVKPGLFTLTPDLKISWTRDIHNKDTGYPCGNVLLADGSVSVVRTTNFAAVVREQNMLTNRLMVP